MAKATILPNGWVSTKLKDILDAVNGKAFKSKDWRTAGTPIIRIQNLKSKDASFNYYSGEIEDKYNVSNGDLLFAWSGTPGTSFGAHIWNGPEALLNQHIFRIDFPGEFICKKYLHLALNKNVDEYIKQAQGGVGLAHITKTKFMNSTLLLPPLNEQNRIVAKIEELFSELDAGVENLTKAKEQLGVYRQSLLKHAFEGKLTEEWRKENADKLESGEALLKRVKKEREEYFKKQLEQWEKDVTQWEADGKPGKKPAKPKKPKKLAPISDEELKELPELPEGWVWVMLEEMCDVKGGITVSSKTKYDDPKEVPYLRVANVQDCNLDLSEIKTIFVSQEKIDQLALQEGDILLNEGGDRDKLGRGWIWESQLPLCIHQNHVFRARQYYRDFPSKYISYYASAMGKPYFMGQGKQTTNLASISLTKMKAFPIPIPPEKEANYIAQEIESKLNESLSTANDLEDRIFQVSILRSSILHAAFSGSLVPQDPNDEPASKLIERIKQERKSAPKPKRTRKPKTKTKRITMADLKEVLATAKDWISAQDAFRQCGVGDGAPTDDVEKLYEELKQQLDLKVIEVERRGDEDWLRLAAEG